MIDEKILDQIVPVPDIQELKEQAVNELRDEGFAVTSFSSGGIFNMLLMIMLKIRIELSHLLRAVLNNMFISHAAGLWLMLKAADYGKWQKTALKTQGYITVMRDGGDGDAVKIFKGHVFKTSRDVNGDELRYTALEDTVLKQGADSVGVLVEAETEGAQYNVPPGRITRSLTHLEGGCTVTNGTDWISREGCDTEDDESLRARALRSWAELSTRPIAEKYKNAAESVQGVLFANVDDDHPRGQGTVDIVVTGTAGEATEGLLTQVRNAVGAIAGTYDDLLVRSSVTVTQEVSLWVTIPAAISGDGIDEQVTAAVTELMRIRRGRQLNELTHADIVHAVKASPSVVRNVKVLAPEADVLLDKSVVIVPGNISVDVGRS